MKNLFTILLATLLIAAGFPAQAAFPLKQPAAASTTTVPTQNAPATAETASIAYTTSGKKQSVRSKRVANTLPQVLYVVLAIFGLGWLAMGINDNFEESDWLISLLLYILMYLPGLIFTLIKMSKYY